MDGWLVVLGTGVAGVAVGVAAGYALGRRGGTKGSGRGSGAAQRKGPAGNGTVELYVGNLSYDVDEKDLRNVFEAYGKVVSVRIITNRLSGRSKGFGFVEIADAGQVGTAIRATNGKDLKGRKLVVNEARSQARDG